jgi:hypothetical protein
LATGWSLRISQTSASAVPGKTSRLSTTRLFAGTRARIPSRRSQYRFESARSSGGSTSNAGTSAFRVTPLRSTLTSVTPELSCVKLKNSDTRPARTISSPT